MSGPKNKERDFQIQAAAAQGLGVKYSRTTLSDRIKAKIGAKAKEVKVEVAKRTLPHDEKVVRGVNSSGHLVYEIEHVNPVLKTRTVVSTKISNLSLASQFEAFEGVPSDRFSYEEQTRTPEELNLYRIGK